MQSNNKLFSTQNMIKMALLSGVAFVLMRMFKFPLPMFPGFLEIDFSEMPAIIATLTVHPLAGLVVVVIKNLLAVLNTYTGGVGELANMAVALGYMLPLALVVRKHSSFKMVSLGILGGIGGIMVTGAIINYFVTIPLFGEAATIEAAAVIIPSITNKMTLVLYAITPFNFIKGIIVSAASIAFLKVAYPMLKYLKPRQTAQHK